MKKLQKKLAKLEAEREAIVKDWKKASGLVLLAPPEGEAQEASGASNAPG